VKDDPELNAHLMQLALDGAQLYVSPEAPPMEGATLETLAHDYLAVMGTIERLSRRMFPEVFEAMVDLPLLEGEDLRDEAKAHAWCQSLEGRLKPGGPGHGDFRVSTRYREDRATYALDVQARHHGLATKKTLGAEFFQSAEYRSLVNLGQQLQSLLSEGAYVRRGDKTQPTSTFKSALSWLMDEARRGIHIQRYKGLGEMNPEQLWETTIDPASRRMLQVRVEDAVAADELFTTLMGDQVEPRRDFIETNALAVANLDT